MKGSIPLTGATTVAVVSQQVLEHTHTFKVTAGDRTLLLAAPDAQVAEEWTAEAEDVVGGINDSMGEQRAALYFSAGSGDGDDAADVA